MAGLIETPCPYLSYTVTRKEYREFLKKWGSFVFYNGVMYTPKVENLGAGMYKVTFSRK